VGLDNHLQGRRLYLDANVFIYALEGYSAFVQLLGDLFDEIDGGRWSAVTSELALAECLVKPMMDGNEALCQTYENAFQETHSLHVGPVTRPVLVQAAALRAQNPALKLPDAIHAATAIACGCQTFVTNDKCLKALPHLHVALLSDIAGA